MKTQNTHCHKTSCLDSKILIRNILILTLLASLLYPASSALAARSAASPASSEVTAYDLIVAMNTLRVSYGHPALIEDAIIDSVAQATAETMAANNMASHIGNVSGRLQSAGFGGGSKVYGTENIALGNFSIDGLMGVWADAAHMLMVTQAAYCNVGAGVAKAANGTPYFVIQAAYIGDKACGEYTSKVGNTTNPGGSTTGGGAGGVSQIIVAVKIATPDADGKIIHVVQPGQTFWAIAIAYKITVNDLRQWNGLTADSHLQIGEKLLIPGPNTKGYATPTPVGLVQTVMPGPDGKIVHAVQPYQTLSTIAQAYGVSVDTLLALNRITIDDPLQIGQKLLVHPSNITPSPTLRPLTPLEKLTQASDGKYYHVVKNGENLAYIADLYKVALKDLMTWNNLKQTSVLQPNQKLLLQVTPPATVTPTPGPATAAPSDEPAQDTLTPTVSATPSLVPAASGTPAADPPSSDGGSSSIWMIVLGAAAAGLIAYGLISRRK
jgi:LysM repeat protein/uncharacterized protein YkwD